MGAVVAVKMDGDVPGVPAESSGAGVTAPGGDGGMVSLLPPDVPEVQANNDRARNPDRT